MKALRVVTAIAVVCATAVFVGLGLWQLSRLREKRAMNNDLRAALAAAPVELRAPLPAARDLRGRRVTLEGVFDPAYPLMLSDRWRGDVPGVELLTPLRLAEGSAVLVDRGWLPADDAIDGHAERYAAAGTRRVLAVAEPIARGAKAPGWTMLARSGSAVVFTARALDSDTLAARIPYPLAPYVLRQLPAAGDTSLPRPELPERQNEAMHLSYAFQWFAMATITIVGSLLASLRARRRSA